MRGFSQHGHLKLNALINDLLRGYVQMHARDEPFQCIYWEKALISNKDLQCHLAMHTGEKPFQW